MKDLARFQYCGASVRGFIAAGAPLFVASDVARLLGYADVDKAVRDHCKRQRPVASLPAETAGYFPVHGKTLVIDEGDVNRLISKSKLTEAEKIQDWWYDEVIPTIRKTGKYETKPLSTLDMIIASAQELKNVEERVTALEAKPTLSYLEVYDAATSQSRYAHTLNTFGNITQDRTMIAVESALLQIDPQYDEARNILADTRKLEGLKQYIDKKARTEEVQHEGYVNASTLKAEPHYRTSWIINSIKTYIGAYRK
jgi:prophage antirepressor-like protein